MESEQFDALVSRLSRHLTRRRSLGVLGALGAASAAGAGMVEGARAGKKKKKRKKKKPTTTQPPATRPPTTLPATTQPPTTPPGPTCSDGIKNGNETDVDCGGSCPRCANLKRCQRSADCQSGICSGGTCLPCSSSGQCDPVECFCSAQGICASRTFRFVNSPTCNACPPEAVACEYYRDGPYNGVLCSPRCGETLPE